MRLRHRTGLAAWWLCPAALTLLVLAGVPCAETAADVKAGEVPAREAFDLGKVWQVHITLSAEEYAAIQPRGGRGFPGFGPQPKEPEKPIDPKREVHRSQFGSDLPWGTGSVAVGEVTFEKVGIRYKGNGTIMDTARTIKK